MQRKRQWKSTLLKLLNGVVSTDAGEILYSGAPIEDYDPVALRREVLLCGQSAFLFDGSVWENFVEYRKYREMPAISREEANTYLKICVAEFPLDAVCTTMSGGERQRVFTAVCLSLKPKVFLLDEPTSALDDGTAYQMMANLVVYCREQNITLVVISHSKALMGSFAEHTIFLEAGNRHE